MKFSLALVPFLLASAGAAAAEVRLATESEILASLSGCWEQEATFRRLELERRGITNSSFLCFGPGNQVETSSIGGDEHGVEGFSDTGKFEVANGKLHLSGSDYDGWIFEAAELSCDVVMRPDVAMRFENCVGMGGEALPNASFTRKAE